TALAGLTLLECGVSPLDEPVLKAGIVIRQAAPKITSTYELSLAILFLDRLGDPGDRPLIQGLALRLIAGQCHTGGWGYSCPEITVQDNRDLIRVLRELEKQPHFDPVVLADNKKLVDLVGTTSPGTSPGKTSPGGTTSQTPSSLAATSSSRRSLPRPGWCIKMEDQPADSNHQARKEQK